MEDQVKFRFNQDRRVQAAGGPTYKAGQTVTMTRASAERWLKRGCGEVVTAETPARREEAAPPADKAVAIPEDWEELNAADMRALAAELGFETNNKPEAVDAIAAEMKRRSEASAADA